MGNSTSSDEAYAVARAHTRATPVLRAMAFPHGPGARMPPPRAVVGTRIRSLRHAIIRSDALTGEAGNPAGPWKTTAGPKDEPMHAFWFGRQRASREPDEIGAAEAETVPESMQVGGLLHEKTTYLLSQPGGQCYLASVINILLSVSAFRRLLRRVFELADADVPDVAAEVIRAPVFPVSVPLPLGLSLLQLMYQQLQLGEFAMVNPGVEAVERRMRGITNYGGEEFVAFGVVLGALGLSWEVAPHKRLRRLRAASDTPAVDFTLAINVAAEDVLPGSYVGFPCVGALLSKGGQSHVIAALDTDIIFDSNAAVCPPVPLPWRGRRIGSLPNCMHTGEIDQTGHSFVLASPWVLSEDPRSVDAYAKRVLQACFKHTEYLSHALLSTGSEEAERAAAPRKLVVDKKHLAAVWTKHGLFHKSVDIDRAKRMLNVRWRRPSKRHPGVLQVNIPTKHGEPLVFRTEKGTLSVRDLRASFPDMGVFDGLPARVFSHLPWLYPVLSRQEFQWLVLGKGIGGSRNH